MPAGFGRLSMAFDEPVTTRIRVGNGVLVVAFDAPVRLDVSKIAKELPDYVSVARADPDGRGIRFGLARSFKANLIEAGDKAFIDLLPQNWAGLPPGPPAEVLTELTRRLHLAEAQAREAARKPAPPRPLTLRSVRLPTLERLVFGAPPETKLTHALVDGTLRLTFDQPLAVEPGAIRSWLPHGMTLAAQETGADSTTLDFSVPKDWQARSFVDDDGLVVDLRRPGKPDGISLASLEATAASAAAQKPPVAEAEPPAAVPPAGATPPEVRGAAAPPSPPVAAAALPDPAPQLVKIEAFPDQAGGRIDFRFPRPTGAASFSDAGTVTLVFDTRDRIDPAGLAGLLPRLVEDAAVTREGKVTLIRLRLSSQQVARLSDDGTTWSLNLGGQAGRPATPLMPQRSADGQGQTVLGMRLPGLTGVHWLERGPDGLPLAVATAFGPTKAVAKPYRYVEFGLLQTAHGVAVSPRADDIAVRAGTEEILIGRSGGLTVTLDVPAPPAVSEASNAAGSGPLLDPAEWNRLRVANIRERARELLAEVASAPRTRKSATRLALARFYAANGLMSEAAGPLQALAADDPSMRADRQVLFLKAAIATHMDRSRDALAALSEAPLKDDPEAALWRGLAEQRLGRPGPALASFRRAGPVLDGYPADLQALFRPAMVRAALAMQDLTVAETQLERFSELRQAADPEELALLRAMLDDAGARPQPALEGYKALFEARSRPVAAEAQLRAVKLALAQTPAAMSLDEAIARLETVAMTWRGGELEIEALAELNRRYVEQQRWREAFQIARRANENYPDNPLTRRMHDETAQRFAEMFGQRDAEQLPRIEALALFYDFKEFLPIGRRGEEITRLLADRLVELDLLDQAADILRHQMEARLSGAARSTVAARLAMIALMNGKPDEALQALHATRLLELPADVRRARLLLEAKALSDLSRTDQALEMLERETGPEVDRLRADIYWTGRRWREAGEAHERILAESWRGPGAIQDGERGDVMRAAISYVMAGEALQLDRLRAKFAAKMAESVDARTFAFVTGADRGSATDIREMARAAGSARTISDFLKAYRERYPALASPPRGQPQPDPSPPVPAAGAEAGAPASQGRG